MNIKEEPRVSSRTHVTSLRDRQTSRFTPRSSKSPERKDNPFRESSVKESAPIIVHKDEQFNYKAPSSIHETVVSTLRREKDNLQMALANQRESANSLASKLTQIGIRNAELERDNEELLMI